MAGDNEASGNGIIIRALKSGFNHTLNVDPDYPSDYVEGVWSNMPVDVEPERFRDKGTTTASVTFTQLQVEAAETFNIKLEYTIYTSP